MEINAHFNACTHGGPLGPVLVIAHMDFPDAVLLSSSAPTVRQS